MPLRLLVPLCFALLTAACGADGPPVPPAGVTVSGTAEMGIAKDGG